MTYRRINSQRSSKRRDLLWMFKVVTAFGALTVMPTSVYAQSDTESARLQITFIKAEREGNGNLFFDGQKYGLSIKGVKIGGFLIKRIDLLASASNLHSASDIIGTYTATDAKDATVGHARMA